MKSNNIYKVLCVVSTLLLLGFAISFGADAHKYCNNIYIGSAPLDLYLLVRTIEFIVPSIITFIVAVIIKKKFVNKE